MSKKVSKKKQNIQRWKWLKQIYLEIDELKAKIDLIDKRLTLIEDYLDFVKQKEKEHEPWEYRG